MHAEEKPAFARCWPSLVTTDAREQAVRSAPTLESVGDKLQDDWLKRAIVGEAPRLRRG